MRFDLYNAQTEYERDTSRKTEGQSSSVEHSDLCQISILGNNCWNMIAKSEWRPREICWSVWAHSWLWKTAVLYNIQRISPDSATRWSWSQFKHILESAALQRWRSYPIRNQGKDCPGGDRNTQTVTALSRRGKPWTTLSGSTEND